MDRVDGAKLSVTAVVSAISVQFGWFGWLVILYVGVMVADWITGSAAAAHAGEWSSRKARDGVWHKCGSVVVLLVAIVVDLLIGAIVNNIPGITLPLTYEVMLSPVVLVWYIVTELGSIVENAEKLGAKIPRFLRKAIGALNAATDVAGDQMVHTEDKESEKRQE